MCAGGSKCGFLKTSLSSGCLQRIYRPHSALQGRQLHQSALRPEKAKSDKPITRAAQRRIETTAAIQDIYRQKQFSSKRPDHVPINGDSPGPLDLRSLGAKSESLADRARPRNIFPPNYTGSRPFPPRDPRTSRPPPNARTPSARSPQARVFRPGQTINTGNPRTGAKFSGVKRAKGRKDRNAKPSRSRPDDYKWEPTEIEKEYLEAKHHEEHDPKPFAPSEITTDSFVGLGPSVPTGTRGFSETLEAKLRAVSLDEKVNNTTRIADLARKLLSGSAVNFRSDQEKTDVLAFAQGLATKRASHMTDAQGKIVQPIEAALESPSPQQQAEVLRGLIQGRYREVGNKSPLFDHVTMMARRNESYLGGDESALAKKVRQLAPALRPAPKKNPIF